MTAEVRTRGVDRRSRRVAPIIAVLAFAGLVASFMQTLVTPIQGQLPELLGAPRDQTAWVFTVTLVAAGVVTPWRGDWAISTGGEGSRSCCSRTSSRGQCCAPSPPVFPFFWSAVPCRAR